MPLNSTQVKIKPLSEWPDAIFFITEIHKIFSDGINLFNGFSKKTGHVQMGIPLVPLPVKLVVAVTYDPASDIASVMNILNTKFGKIEYNYGPVPFSWTEYYASEMGDSLMKCYFNYKTLIDRQELIDIKLFTNSIEEKYSVMGRRKVNIDPGYLARDKFVLMTTKDFYHRLYLGKGIFGEETLHYRKGRYRYFSWTYPDYKQKPVFEFLESARATLVKELRNIEDSQTGSFEE